MSDVIWAALIAAAATLGSGGLLLVKQWMSDRRADRLARAEAHNDTNAELLEEYRLLLGEERTANDRLQGTLDRERSEHGVTRDDRDAWRMRAQTSGRLLEQLLEAKERE